MYFFLNLSYISTSKQLHVLLMNLEDVIMPVHSIVSWKRKLAILKRQCIDCSDMTAPTRSVIICLPQFFAILEPILIVFATIISYRGVTYRMYTVIKLSNWIS